MTATFQTDAFQTGAFQTGATVVVPASKPWTLEIRDPYRLTLQQWTDSMGLQFGLVVYEKAGSDWQGWASRLILEQELVLDHVPDPYQFSDWKSWADSFNRALTSASY